MRTLTLAALLLFIASPLTQAQAQQTTAYQALRLIGRQVNRAYLNRVISVTGTDGDPQPTRWRILVGDKSAPGGVRQFEVANGRIVSNSGATTGVVGSAQNAMFAAAKLNLDSDGAFNVASYTANTSHVNFDSAAYTLRTNDRGIPIWIVTLQDNSRRSVGTIHINAAKGNVTRVEGLFRGANMAQVGEDRNGDTRVARIRPERTQQQPEGEYLEPSGDEDIDVPEEEDENVVKAELKRLFRHTRDGARRVFERTRNSFQDFMER
jgi:hypothetical protein